MELTEIITLGAAVLALVIAGYAFLWRREPVTFAGALEALESTEPLAAQIRDVAEVIVEGVQQLKETGKIETGTEAFAVAMAHLKQWFPDVEPDLLVPFVEGAYRAVRMGTELAKAQRWGVGE
jgi:hypothetical protein